MIANSFADADPGLFTQSLLALGFSEVVEEEMAIAGGIERIGAVVVQTAKILECFRRAGFFTGVHQCVAQAIHRLRFGRQQPCQPPVMIRCFGVAVDLQFGVRQLPQMERICRGDPDQSRQRVHSNNRCCRRRRMRPGIIQIQKGAIHRRDSESG